MIKRIIFDIDNTLLDTSKDCFNAYQEYIDKYGLSITPELLYEVIGEYEALKRNYQKNDLANYITSKIEKFTYSSLEELLEIYGTNATLINNKTDKILEYLSKKYEIVALSNWYVEPQKRRLETAGILKYFKEVYGLENAGIKPDKKTFDIAKGNHKYNECLIIGDNKISDIEIPEKLGMKAIFLNKNRTKKINREISDLKELEKII